MKRTDLACEIASDNQHFEGIELKEYNIGSVGVSHIIISKDGEKSTGRPKGTYITLHCRRRDRYDEVRAVSQVLSGMLPDGDILAAGFGNCDITPDSLGTRTVRRIAATAHLAAHNDFAALGMRKVYAVEAGVTGRTGIESTDSIELTSWVRMTEYSSPRGLSMCISESLLSFSGSLKTDIAFEDIKE